MKKLLLKYKELILYVFFGVLTTLVNFGTFWVFTRTLGDKLYLLSNAIAWVVGVAFAFVTNKLFVFESKTWEVKKTFRELTEFVAARLFSFGVEEGGMLLFVEALGFGEKSIDIFNFTISGTMITKIILAVIVVVLNYFFSKFVIFKKKNSKKSDK